MLSLNVLEKKEFLSSLFYDYVFYLSFVCHFDKYIICESIKKLNKRNVGLLSCFKEFRDLYFNNALVCLSAFKMYAQFFGVNALDFAELRFWDIGMRDKTSILNHPCFLEVFGNGEA